MKNILLVGLDIGKGSFGGVTQFSKLLLKYSDKKNYKVSYFSLGKSPNWHHGGWESNKFIYYTLHFYKYLKFVIQLFSKRIHVVLINSSLKKASLVRDGLFAYTASLLGKKCIILIHGWYWDDFNNIINSKKQKKIFLKLFNKIYKIGVSGEHFRDSLEKINIKKDKTFAFSTMVESDTYKADPVEKNNVPIQVLFCSNPIQRKKGIYEFLTAVSYLNIKEEVARYVVMGSGSELENVISTAKSLKIKKKINFVGYVSYEEKIKIFKETNILVFPSYTEGFPNTVLEAMSSGQAIIATNVGGISEAISHDKGGYVLETNPPEPEEIAKYLNLLIMNKEIINEMGVLNIKKVESKYDVKIVTALIESNY